MFHVLETILCGTLWTVSTVSCGLRCTNMFIMCFNFLGRDSRVHKRRKERILRRLILFITYPSFFFLLNVIYVFFFNSFFFISFLQLRSTAPFFSVKREQQYTCFVLDVCGLKNQRKKTETLFCTIMSAWEAKVKAAAAIASLCQSQFHAGHQPFSSFNKKQMSQDTFY